MNYSTRQIHQPLCHTFEEEEKRRQRKHPSYIFWEIHLLRKKSHWTKNGNKLSTVHEKEWTWKKEKSWNIYVVLELEMQTC